LCAYKAEKHLNGKLPYSVDMLHMVDLPARIILVHQALTLEFDIYSDLSYYRGISYLQCTLSNVCTRQVEKYDLLIMFLQSCIRAIPTGNSL